MPPRPGRGTRRAGLVAALLVLACTGGVGTGAVLMRLGRWPAGLPRLFPPTATPTATVPPTLTPSATPPPSPTPTPTPVPLARISQADEALYDGDWSLAAADYQAVLDQGKEPAVRAAALLGLGKTRLSAGDMAGAIEALTTFVQDFPNTPHVADAQFLLGDAYRAAGQPAEAIAAYRAYLALRPGTVDAYVQAGIAQAALQAGDTATAIEALRAALAAPRYTEDLDLREQLAGALAASGDLEGALAEYETVFNHTDQDWRRARADVLAGQLLYNAGRTEEAYAKFQHAVTNYPATASAFDALVALINDGAAVDDLPRGLTNFYAKNYEPALAAFKRYREAYAAHDPAASAEGDATALYVMGQTYAALGQDAQALASWRELLEAHPADHYWTQAYFQIAFLLPYPDDVETFEAFVRAVPHAPEAPDALYRAARLHERHDDLADAARLWTRIAREYPEAEQAADAAMQAGLALYRAGDYATAAQRFELAATLGGDPDQHARAWLWQGKVKQKRGDTAGARVAFIKAMSFGPHGYYPLRAAQLLRGEAPFTPSRGYSLTFDQAAEQTQVDLWLRATFPLAQSVAHPSELQPGVWQEARFVRGSELWRLGRLREAHDELDSLRQGMSGDPLAAWQLALYFSKLGAYDLSIRAARAVVDLAQYPDTLNAPRYILLLRYPAPFAARVRAAAQEYHLSPLLMYAKMRIESFFWKYAHSSADARGLNQFIPPTADDVASRMGLDNFTYEDLFRPAVSIPMGAYYLSYIAGVTGGEAEVLMAGYYAGPSNAQTWLELSGGDPDLFVEVIRLPDAKGYVQTTFEYFEEYKVLYGK